MAFFKHFMSNYYLRRVLGPRKWDINKRNSVTITFYLTVFHQPTILISKNLMNLFCFLWIDTKWVSKYHSMRPNHDQIYSRKITLFHVSKVIPLSKSDAFNTLALKIATLCKLAICALLQLPVTGTKIDTIFWRKHPEYNRSLHLLIKEKMHHKLVANHVYA